MKEKQMFKIYIDSTERYSKSVSLYKVIESDESLVAKKEGDIDVTSSIKELLEENNVKVSDLMEVIPNLGPGSFTGLKIGVAIANILEWALGRKTIDQLYMPNYGKDPNITPKKF